MRKTSVLATALTVAALGLSGCGESSDASTETENDLTIQAAPVADYAALYVGLEHDIFESHGLKVQAEVGQSGAATVAAVMSGEVSAGGSAIVPLVNASSRDVPVRLVAPAGTSTEGREDYIGVVVAPDSDITDIKDLSDGKIAVNGLKSFLELVTRKAVDNDGGTSTNTEFLDIPNSEMQRAVENGQVDAAVMNEPFLSQAQEAGLEVVGFPNKAVSEDLLISGYFVSEDFANDNPQTVENLQAAIAEAQEYAEEHPDEVRSILEENNNASDGSLDAIQLPRYVNEIDQAVVTETISTMDEYNFLDKPTQVDDFVLDTP